MPGEVSNIENSAPSNVTPVAQAASTAVTSPAPGPNAGAAPAASPVEANQERGEDGRFKSSAQERIDELTRGKSSAEIERDYWRSLVTSSAKANAPAPAPAPKEPDIKDFSDYNAYVDALATFRAEQIIDKRLSERDQSNTRKSAAQKAVETYHGREAAARAEIPDYDAVLSASNLPLEPHVGSALFESELGPQIAYHLAKNPALLDELNKMDVRSVDRKIGRLEDQLAKATAPAPAAESPAAGAPAPMAGAPAAPAARTTNAPTPAKPIAQPGPATPVDLSKLSMDDYVKTRKSQGAAWAR